MPELTDWSLPCKPFSNLLPFAQILSPKALGQPKALLAAFVFFQSGHDFDEVAGAVAIVELRF